MIALTNEKGGVGKSTTALNLAECLARAGDLRIAPRSFRVLAVDADPQGDLSKGLGLRTPAERLPSLANALTLEGVELPEDAIRPVARVPGLDLLPGHAGMARVERAVARSADPLAEELRLKQLVDYLAGVRGYDFVVVDCPPRGYSPIFSMAMRAADTYLVPVQLKYFAADGVQGLFDAVNEFEAEHGYAPLLLGILLTMVDYRLAATRDQVAQMRERYGEYLLETLIRQNNDLETAQHGGTSVFVERRGCWGDRNYRALAAEVLARCRAFRLID